MDRTIRIYTSYDNNIPTKCYGAVVGGKFSSVDLTILIDMIEESDGKICYWEQGEIQSSNFPWGPSVGPHLQFSSPWSSNVISIAKRCGVSDL